MKKNQTCLKCGEENSPFANFCAYCKAKLDAQTQGETLSPSSLKKPTSTRITASENRDNRSDSSTVETGNSEDDAERIKKVFKWFLWGWVAFFLLAYMAIDLKRGIELLGTIFFAIAAAFVSTLIYWGIREFLKQRTETTSKAAATESEIAELRRQVEELSRKTNK